MKVYKHNKKFLTYNGNVIKLTTNTVNNIDNLLKLNNNVIQSKNNTFLTIQENKNE